MFFPIWDTNKSAAAIAQSNKIFKRIYVLIARGKKLTKTIDMTNTTTRWATLVKILACVIMFLLTNIAFNVPITSATSNSISDTHLIGIVKMLSKAKEKTWLFYIMVQNILNININLNK
jgi:hypothetical protein